MIVEIPCHNLLVLSNVALVGGGVCYFNSMDEVTILLSSLKL